PQRADEMRLSEHVVELEAGARDDDAAGGAHRARERRGIAVDVDRADVRRAAERLGPGRVLRLHRPDEGHRGRLRVTERLEPNREQAAAPYGERDLLRT